MKDIILTFISIFFSATLVLGQTNEDTIKPLSIGDKVPNITLANIMNYKSQNGKKISSAQIFDFKGKLLILDFWATWCSSCIYNFPKMEVLQKDFGDKIQIMAVTDESSKKINDFFTSKAGSNYNITSAVNDTILKKMFPHRGIPHCVWINGDGEVVAITGADEVTSSNINDILAKQIKKITTKIDIDPEKPLFLSENFPGELGLSYYSILIKGHYSGLPSGTQFRTADNITYGRSVTNSVLLQIYEAAVRPLFTSLNDSYSDKRLLIKVRDETKITMTRGNDGRWDTANEYNYDLIVPKEKSDSLYNYMLNDLNRYTPYFGKIEKRLTKCLVLTRMSTIDKIKTKGGALENTIPARPSKLINGPISFLVMRLNEEDAIKLPIVDETNYSGNVDIRLSGTLELQALRKELQQYDLDLTTAERYINTFILNDKINPLGK